MRFLFVVQGEGRGHMTQAIALSEMLRRNNHEVVKALVGSSGMRKIPAFFSEQICVPIQTYASPNFLKTKDNKRFRIFNSIVYNLKRKNRKAYFDSIRLINKSIDEIKPDIVVNFYELLVGLAYRRYKIQTPMICVAHQFVFEHSEYKFTHQLNPTQRMLRIYTSLCSLNARKRVALSFVPMAGDTGKRLVVAPPLLRREIVDLPVSAQPYWLGYILNHGFSEEIITWHSQHPEMVIHVFWDHPDALETYQPHPNLSFHQLNDKLFIDMMAHCSAFFGTAGFESICESLFLNKPTMIVPAHAEQQLNAMDAKQSGKVSVASSFDLDRLKDAVQCHNPEDTGFRDWVKQSERIWLREICITES